MKGGTMYEQRDIVLIPFPYSDLTGIKQRPALIVSNSKLNKTQDRICCLITSNPTTEGIKIDNNSFEKDKLPFQSWVKSHRIFTIHERIIRKKLCTVSKRFHEIIMNSINEYLISD